MKYKKIREKSLVLWQEVTGRDSSSLVDDINNSYECDWQVKNVNHVSIFCSLGVWSSCFSLQLKDIRFDDLDMDDQGEGEALNLQFNQMLLVVSEILNDLCQMYKQATNRNDGRQFLSSGSAYSVGDIFAFINNIVKHKAEGSEGNSFHSCNHHLPVRFADSTKTRKSAKSIAMGQITNLSVKKSIYMPSLVLLVTAVGCAYYNLNVVLSEAETYERIAQLYE